ncbi:MAG: hypothetical protein ABSC42_08785 [Tepidisphaeraceae bacterium]|jgi:hypothetical protein
MKTPYSWPAHVVCVWIGNSEVVARDHHLQITDEHFAKAAGTADETGGAESESMGDTGFEQVSNSVGNWPSPSKGRAEYGAIASLLPSELDEVL